MTKTSFKSNAKKERNALRLQKELDRQKAEKELDDGSLFPGWKFETVGRLVVVQGLKYVNANRLHHRALPRFPWYGEFCYTPALMRGHNYSEKLPKKIVSSLEVLEVYSAVVAAQHAMFENIPVDEKMYPTYKEMFDNSYNALLLNSHAAAWKYQSVKNMLVDPDVTEAAGQMDFLRLAIACTGQCTFAEWVHEYELFYHKTRTICEFAETRAKVGAPHADESKFRVDMFKESGRGTMIEDMVRKLTSRAMTIDFEIVPFYSMTKEMKVASLNNTEVCQAFVDAYEVVARRREAAGDQNISLERLPPMPIPRSSEEIEADMNRIEGAEMAQIDELMKRNEALAEQEAKEDEEEEDTLDDEAMDEEDAEEGAETIERPPAPAPVEPVDAINPDDGIDPIECVGAHGLDFTTKEVAEKADKERFAKANNVEELSN